MYENTARELRNIRITLVVLTIILLFSGSGNSEIVIPENDESQEVYNHFKNSSMVDLGDGYFGILIGDADSWSDQQTLKVYYYNKESNKLEYKTETYIED